nr:DNA-directed RNA polymerase subunit beta' [Tanacetum cinerariifolium]
DGFYFKHRQRKEQVTSHDSCIACFKSDEDHEACKVERTRFARVMQDTDDVDVDGVGKVAISFKSGEVQILSNVLYVPIMKINLLSTDKLDYNGYTFHYKGKEVVINEGRELVGKGS